MISNQMMQQVARMPEISTSAIRTGEGAKNIPLEQFANGRKKRGNNSNTPEDDPSDQIPLVVSHQQEEQVPESNIHVDKKFQILDPENLIGGILKAENIPALRKDLNLFSPQELQFLVDRLHNTAYGRSLTDPVTGLGHELRVSKTTKAVFKLTIVQEVLAKKIAE